ncbi:DUF6473 family protein [Ovoidimarina sediminis]|uniref:DUF6473 family protein n=1 Tax=Ovoidimarina sediminis TaxID=3079856 RepID=UPI00292D3D2F|nr:DUF6473 family protein [Rhodophyticola sp. MJ-SS7]
MAFLRLSDGALDYSPCQYGTSKLRFRGPRVPLSPPYYVCLGGTVTYGKFIERPFPDLLAGRLEHAVVNLGRVNAGLDTFVEDPTVLELCRNAKGCIVEVPGAHMLSNRLYSVHLRRNDRVISSTQQLRTLYPEADLTEIHFVRHLLCVLREIDAVRFVQVVAELEAAWLARMRTLIEGVDVPVTLLWIRPRPDQAEMPIPTAPDPLFITESMIDDLRPVLAGVVTVERPPRSDMPAPGMIYADVERLAASELPGPDVHRQIAGVLSPALAPAV